jgi:hypothetical protein
MFSDTSRRETVMFVAWWPGIWYLVSGVRAGSILEYSSFGGLSPSGALRATPVPQLPPFMVTLIWVCFALWYLVSGIWCARRLNRIFEFGIGIGIGIGVRPCSIVAEFR